MLFMLGAEATGNGIGMTILLGILVVLMIVYLIFGTINRKKQQEQAMKMMNELKAGDKVVTNAGVYGTIVSMRETNMGRVVVLKTGSDDNEENASYITINASVILGIDKKEDLILDENGNVIDPSEKLKEEVMGDAEKGEEAQKSEEVAPVEEKKVARKKSNKKTVSEKMSTNNKKKQKEQHLKMISELKVDDKVVTKAGVYGTIVSIKETDKGKIVVLKTGDDDNEKDASYITVKASVISSKDKKKKINLDKDY